MTSQIPMKIKYSYIVASVLFCALSAISQPFPESSLKVSYLYEYNTTGPYSGKSEYCKDDFLLLTSPLYSYFYGVTTHYLDSIYSNQKSKSEYSALRLQLMKASPKAKFDSQGHVIYSPGDKELGLPTKGSEIQVIKDFANKNLKVYDAFGDKKYFYNMPLRNIDWVIEDSTKNILQRKLSITRYIASYCLVA